MHYCTLLITKELPSINDIEEILKPYNDDIVYQNEGAEHPPFMWDYYRIGGRYMGTLKLKVEGDDDLYQWQYYLPTQRNGRLFHSSLLSTLKEHIQPIWMYTEEDYFNVMGYRDGFLYVDGARIADIININDLDGYICIKPSGESFVRGFYDGGEYTEMTDFDERVQNVIAENQDGFITILDLHD